MNTQVERQDITADRQALTAFINKRTAAGPTGLAYIATDGTIWHQYTNLDADGDAPMWATTRTGAVGAFTYRITDDMMVLEEAF